MMQKRVKRSDYPSWDRPEPLPSSSSSLPGEDEAEFLDSKTRRVEKEKMRKSRGFGGKEEEEVWWYGRWERRRGSELVELGLGGSWDRSRVEEATRLGLGI